MAAPSTCQYNLRSNGNEVHLFVELHMAFMRDLLHAQKSSSSGQVSDNDSSINESDCEALIATSDDESGSGNEGTSTQTLVKKSDPAKSDVSQSTSQQAINMQILAQLQTFRSRLDAMEKKSCKKVMIGQISKVKVPNVSPNHTQRLLFSLFTRLVLFMIYRPCVKMLTYKFKLKNACNS